MIGLVNSLGRKILLSSVSPLKKQAFTGLRVPDKSTDIVKTSSDQIQNADSEYEYYRAVNAAHMAG